MRVLTPLTRRNVRGKDFHGHRTERVEIQWAAAVLCIYRKPVLRSGDKAKAKVRFALGVLNRERPSQPLPVYYVFLSMTFVCARCTHTRNFESERRAPDVATFVLGPWLRGLFAQQLRQSGVSSRRHGRTARARCFFPLVMLNEAKRLPKRIPIVVGAFTFSAVLKHKHCSRFTSAILNVTSAPDHSDATTLIRTIHISRIRRILFLPYIKNSRNVTNPFRYTSCSKVSLFIPYLMQMHPHMTCSLQVKPTTSFPHPSEWRRAHQRWHTEEVSMFDVCRLLDYNFARVLRALPAAHGADDIPDVIFIFRARALTTRRRIA